jgi:hypothetical protein
MDRMAQIKLKAAESAGPVASGSSDAVESDGDGGPADITAAYANGIADPLAAAGLTVLQYDILLERIKRFCDELKANAALGKGGSGGVKIPGSGTNMFWVYSPAEAQTLSQANCQRVYDLIGQLI